MYRCTCSCTLTLTLIHTYTQPTCSHPRTTHCHPHTQHTHIHTCTHSICSTSTPNTHTPSPPHPIHTCMYTLPHPHSQHTHPHSLTPHFQHTHPHSPTPIPNTHTHSTTHFPMHSTSLDALDPNAYAAFQASNDLQDVVDRVLSQRSGSDGGAAPTMKKTLSIRASLMTPVKPMLVRPAGAIYHYANICL